MFAPLGVLCRRDSALAVDDAAAAAAVVEETPDDDKNARCVLPLYRREGENANEEGPVKPMNKKNAGESKRTFGDQSLRVLGLTRWRQCRDGLCS